MNRSTVWSHCAIFAVVFANALPSDSVAGYCAEKNTIVVKAEEGRSLLQRSVQRSAPGLLFLDDKLGASAHREAELSGDSESGLRKFWVIALSSYFISLVMSFGVWWHFLTPKVSSSASDSEDEEDLVSRSTSATTAIARAEADELEGKPRARISWLSGTKEERLQVAALTAFIISLTMGVYALLRFVHRPDCSPFRPYVHIPEMCFLGCMIALTGYCWISPRHICFWPALAMLLLYIPSVTLPPFNMSCATLQSQECRADDHWRISQAVNHVDCSLQGQTAQQIFLTMFLLLPWLLPEMKYIYFMAVWVFSVYIVWSVAYFRYSEDTANTFDALDVVTRCILLVCTLFAALLKKYYVQKSQQNKFMSELARREDSMKLYNILEFMLPEHVILSMLTHPDKPIADPIAECSILFIVIDDFESIVRAKSPELLLRFLNTYFIKFDAICRYYGVQKIETVGEEYVCCVGVTPDDVKESEQYGHGSVISKLFKASSAILHQQTDTVKFKMGMHTGPIVAGVIAQKLPRFRLFGDTINTAARMMQKGQVGMLQFGEETQRYLPADMKSEPRGAIEMKGKGKVQTFLLSPAQRQSTVVSERTGSPDFARTADSDENESDDDAFQARSLLKVLLKPNREIAQDHNSKRHSLRNPFHHSRSRASREVKPGTSKSQRNFTQVMKQITDDTNRKAAGIISDTMNCAFPSWILSEQVGFTDEMEKEFRLTFHQDHTCKKIEQRLDLQLLGLFMLTMMEFLWNIPDPRHPELGWSQEHDIFGTWSRRPLFIGCRAVAISIVAGLRFGSSSKVWFKENPEFQNCLVLSSWCVALSMFVSYDVMITGVPQASDARVRVLAPFDQVFSLVFVLLFFFICSAHKVLFRQSLVFVPLSLLIIVLSSLRSHAGIYFPPIGQVLFVIIAISFSVLSHHEEQGLRGRYKALHAAKETTERVETILKTMMPPMVLEQVQNSPIAVSVHHQYEKATIAQSDLCGFTKIAAKKLPTEVVTIISELFGSFDKLTDQFGVYKVETVGDAYIGGQAEHPLTAENSPSSVIQFGIAMISEVIGWSRRLGLDVQCRVGVHHGSCIGGIVDKEMQRYHIFGALMQVIEILESTAPEGSVQVSPACREAVLRERKETGLIEKPELRFKERDIDHLTTSKGERHEFEETGGHTFVIQGPALQRCASLAGGKLRHSASFASS